MAWDASRQNEKRSRRGYKDLNLNFSANPVTQDVTTVTDVISVKRSIRNLLLTNHYDRPFHPEIGSNIQHLLFEPINPVTGNQLSRTVQEMIENFEPRARVENVECVPIPESNNYDITIQFYIENMPAELQEMQTLLQAVR